VREVAVYALTSTDDSVEVIMLDLDDPDASPTTTEP
jgi:hypothetical protein